MIWETSLGSSESPCQTSMPWVETSNSAIAFALPGEPFEPGDLPVEVPARLAEVLQLRLQRVALRLEPGAPAVFDDVADAEIVVLRDLDALNGLSTSLAPSRARRVVLRVVYLFVAHAAKRALKGALD